MNFALNEMTSYKVNENVAVLLFSRLLIFASIFIVCTCKENGDTASRCGLNYHNIFVRDMNGLSCEPQGIPRKGLQVACALKINFNDAICKLA